MVCVFVLFVYGLELALVRFLAFVFHFEVFGQRTLFHKLFVFCVQCFFKLTNGFIQCFYFLMGYRLLFHVVCVVPVGGCVFVYVKDRAKVTTNQIFLRLFFRGADFGTCGEVVDGKLVANLCGLNGGGAVLEDGHGLHIQGARVGVNP